MTLNGFLDKARGVFNAKISKGEDEDEEEEEEGDDNETEIPFEREGRGKHSSLIASKSQRISYDNRALGEEF